MNERIQNLKKMFIQIYGENETKLRVFAAPGRVNLIGEHIDYCGGYVFPAAITQDTVIILRKRNDRIIRLAATDLPDRVQVSLNAIKPMKATEWGSYQLGVADELQKNGYNLIGADMLFDDTTPHGAGLSSSAAIEVATAYALATIANEETGSKNPVDKVEMAVISQMAEHNFLGVSCGIMDQFASAMGKEGHAILLDCATLKYKYAPLNLGNYRIVLANTKKKRSLSESKYNERTIEVAEGLKIMKKFLPDIKHLCDIKPMEFESFKEKINDAVIRKRVEHVVYENHRVIKAFEALQRNDIIDFGELLKEAHESISKLYEVSGFELDVMVEEALKVEGVVGSRMTGAGFGGCTVNIVESDKVGNFIEQVGKNYKERTGLTPEFYISSAGEGVREIKESD